MARPNLKPDDGAQPTSGVGHIPPERHDVILDDWITVAAVAADGHVYDRDSFNELRLAWERRFPGAALISPVTGEPLSNLDLRLVEATTDEAAPLPTSEQDRALLTGNENYVSINDQLGPIFACTDLLRDILPTFHWQPPQVVVVGNESSGKSTLLERLAMMPLFPRDRRICTRMPILIRLRRGPNKVCILRVVRADTQEPLREVPIAIEKADNAIRDAMHAVLTQENAQVSGVSMDKMLLVDVQKPELPDIDLVDMPGLVAANTSGEPDDMPELTRRLLTNYMDKHNDHSLYLLVIKATDQANASSGMRLVQERGLHDRTIGVFTKVDLLKDEDEEEEDYPAQNLRSKVLQQDLDVPPLQPHGYVATSNRKVKAADTMSNHNRLRQQAFNEVQFFKDKGVQDLVDQHRAASSNVLIGRLSEMYTEYVKREWAPNTLFQMWQAEQGLGEELQELGLPPAHTMELASANEHSHRAVLSKDAIEVVTSILESNTNKWMQDLVSTCVLPLQERVVSALSQLTGSMEVGTSYHLLADVRQQVVDVIKEATASCDLFLLQSLRQALQSDTSNFKLVRFPAVIDAIVSQYGKELEVQAIGRQSKISHCTNAFFEVDPLANQALIFTYNLSHTTPPTVTLYCNPSVMCDALAHFILHGTPVQLSADGLRDALKAVGEESWVESCAEERKATLSKISAIQTARNQLLPLLGVESADGIPQYLSKVYALSDFEWWRGVMITIQQKSTILSLHDNQIDEDGAIALSKVLPQMPKLVELELGNNQIGLGGTIVLSKVLPQMPQLQKLDLGNSQIGDFGAVALSKVLPQMPQLQELSLYDNQIGENGAIALSKVLPQMPQLQMLFLNNNQIGEGGAIALSKVLPQMPKFQNLL